MSWCLILFGLWYGIIGCVLSDYLERTIPRFVIFLYWPIIVPALFVAQVI